MESDYLAGYCATTKALADPFVHFQLPLGMYTPVCQLIWSQKKNFTNVSNVTYKQNFFFGVFFFLPFTFLGGMYEASSLGVNKHRFHHCCRAARVAWVNETRFKDTVHKYARRLVRVAHVIFRARKTCLKCTKRARPYPKSRHYHNTIQSNNMLILKIQLPSNQ